MRIRTAAAFTIAAAMAATQCALAGWQYTTETTTDSAGQMTQATPMTVVGWVDGKKAKLEYRESANPVMKAGTYLVTQDGGQTLYLVNPAERSYSKWDMQAMMTLAGGAMQMMKMEFTDMKVEKLLDEPGETICGFPTRHCKIRTSYSMSMNFMGMKQASHVVQEQDVWSTAKLDAAGFAVWLKATQFKTGSEDLDKLISAETSKLQGFPLKTEMVQTTRNAKGKEKVTKSTCLVKEVKELKIDDAQFVPPADYKEVSMMPDMSSDDAAAGGATTNQGAKSSIPFGELMKLMPKRAP